MKNNSQNGILKSAIMFLLFLIYTALVCLVDVKPIGPQSAKVGFAKINSFFVEKIGTHDIFATITDLLAALSFAVVLAFAVLGLYQLIKGKKLSAVDSGIIIMGCLYVLIGVFYVLFEKVIINYRPVLVEGVLEASYPSSHTMLVVTIFGSAIVAVKKLFRDKQSIVKIATVVSIVIIILAVIGRILAGVHWFSDIIGSLFLSAFLIQLYSSVSAVFEKAQ